MKRYFYSLLVGVAMLFSSCTTMGQDLSYYDDYCYNGIYYPVVYVEHVPHFWYDNTWIQITVSNYCHIRHYTHPIVYRGYCGPNRYIYHDRYISHRPIHHPDVMPRITTPHRPVDRHNPVFNPGHRDNSHQRSGYMPNRGNYNGNYRPNQNHGNHDRGNRGRR